MRKGVRLQFYFPEGARHHHHLLHEWLLQAAGALDLLSHPLRLVASLRD